MTKPLFSVLRPPVVDAAMDAVRTGQPLSLQQAVRKRAACRTLKLYFKPLIHTHQQSVDSCLRAVVAAIEQAISNSRIFSTAKLSPIFMHTVARLNLRHLAAPTVKLPEIAAQRTAGNYPCKDR